MGLPQQLRGDATFAVFWRNTKARDIARENHQAVESHGVGDDLHGADDLAVFANGDVLLVGIFLFEIDVHEFFAVVEAFLPERTCLLFYFLWSEYHNIYIWVGRQKNVLPLIILQKDVASLRHICAAGRLGGS
mgnify:FL=1